MMHESAMDHRLHVGVSSSSDLVHHHAAFVFEISQHAICVVFIPEYVLFSRFRDGRTYDRKADVLCGGWI